jgi:hypothetical protein
MPRSIKSWLMFGLSVLAILFVVNNVAFLGQIVGRRS